MFTRVRNGVLAGPVYLNELTSHTSGGNTTPIALMTVCVQDFLLAEAVSPTKPMRQLITTIVVLT